MLCDLLENVPLVISVRGFIGLMAFFAYFILNSQRANMGITILCIYPKFVSDSISNSTHNTSMNATQNNSSNANDSVRFRFRQN